MPARVCRIQPLTEPIKFLQITRKSNNILYIFYFGYSILIFYSTRERQQRKRQHSSSTPEDSKKRKAAGPRTPSVSDDGSRTSSPVSPPQRPKSVTDSVTNGKGEKVETIEDLKNHHAATWKGPINLKKVDYTIK